MYCTLEQVIAEIKAEDASITAASVVNGKAYILQALEWVAGRIDTETHQTFAPIILPTRYFDATKDTIDFYRNLFFLDYPLLSASAVTVLDTTLTLWDGVYANKAAADYIYRPRNQTPYYALQGLQANNVWNPYQYGMTIGGWADIADAIGVTGTWGYRTQYATQGYGASGDTVQNNPLSSSATSITVTDADGVGYDGTTPRFTPGQILQIESEWVYVRAVNTTTNVLTVQRGFRGSTAASHAQNTAISVFIPEPDINRAAVRYCAFLYHRRAVYQNFVISADGASAIQFPQDIPPEVNGQLHDYRLELFRTVVV